MSKRAFFGAALALLWAQGCSSKVTIYQVFVTGGAAGASSDVAGTSTNGGDGVAQAGTAPSNGGTNAMSAAGESTQGGSASTAGAGGEANPAGGAPGAAGGAPGAAGDANPSAGAAGAGGTCDTFVADDPPDCHASLACDSSMRVVDQNNVPIPANTCFLGTCNAQGVPGTAPADAGTPCNAAGGGKLCDGAGKCVACLGAADCPGGQVCSEKQRCVADTCTDLDCGGVCPPCVNGKKCLADADCESFACDAASLTCVTAQCQDHRQDGVETDADCGGDVCTPCPIGKSCILDRDCLSDACDGIKLVCVTSQCYDHRQDGVETDIDCGGPNGCNICAPGLKCKTNFDCWSGHFCNADKVCQ